MKSKNRDAINEKLGAVFKKYREAKKLTQDKVSEELGISEKYVSRIENGTGGVKSETLVNYINLLGIEPNVLFKELISNDDLQLKMSLSKETEDLTDTELEFVLKVVKAMKEIREQKN